MEANQNYNEQFENHAKVAVSVFVSVLKPEITIFTMADGNQILFDGIDLTWEKF